MKAEKAKIIPFSQTEPDHWLVDVCTNNDDSVEIKWVPEDNRYKRAAHWLVFVAATSAYNLPGLIAKALNLLEYEKTQDTCYSHKENRATL